MPLKNRPGKKRGSGGPHPYNLRQAIARFEKGYLANILELTRWDQIKAAQMLGIDNDLLASKIRDYELYPGDRPSIGEK